MATMMKKIFFVLPLLMCAVGTTAQANWEYNGEYVRDGYYTDDGGRFSVSLRGGMSYGMGKIKNDMGNLTTNYYSDGVNVTPEHLCGGSPAICIANGYNELGYAQLGNLSPKDDFREISFAGGASVGWILPHHNSWRLEAGWDKIAEADYNASPLFDGSVQLSSGDTVSVQSGSVQSTVSTDIISVMAFYDFFDGNRKPVNTFIPYVGFGIGYAQSKTTLQLTDSYGDLSSMYDLLGYGTPDANGVIIFNKSEKTMSNVAGILALGASYGVTERIFFDFGVRLMYVPKVKWVLSDSEGSRTRDWFHADNMIYANLMLGLRFEF